MNHAVGCSGRVFVGFLAALAIAMGLVAPLIAAIDTSQYMSPDEIEPGMKGFGRTVMAGTEIETFQFEVLSVMKNAFYAKQDVILVRLSGLNLEHSGVIAGMSGSPCYIRDATTGRERMIGAVAWGYTGSKDPICGLQPITQMLSIPDIRDPANRPKSDGSAMPVSAKKTAPEPLGAGRSIGELLAQVWSEPIQAGSRFSVLQDKNSRILRSEVSDKQITNQPQLRPLVTPMMVSGVGKRTMAWLRDRFEPLGLMPMASGGPGAAGRAMADKVILEPGAVVCIPLMTGDLAIDAVGTCTEVIGDKVLGFGHQMFGRGFVELPMATGMVHGVIPSIIQSWKMGTSLKIVGTLWGDENTGIFGINGSRPRVAPLDVVVNDIRGERSYHYEVVRDRLVTAILIVTGAMESVYAHHYLPQDHVVKYDIQVDFEGLGSFKTSNFTSAVDTYGLTMDLLVPALLMANTPFGEAKVDRVRVNVTIEPVTKAARIDRLYAPKAVYKPGETITARVRWFHLRTEPTYSEDSYKLTLPSDLPDGVYTLIVGSAESHIAALRKAKPHRWRVENLAEVLNVLNLSASFPEDRLYLHLTLPKGGLAIGRVEMPELPSYRRKIVADAKRSDVQPYQEALLVDYETGFAVDGSQSLQIEVKRQEQY